MTSADGTGVSVEASALRRRARPLTTRSIGPPVLALVPHADDETLGCGGLLAGLFARGADVHLVLVTDGGASHPRASGHTRAQRAAVREAEFAEAIRHLGGRGGDALRFWRQPDGALDRVDGGHQRASVAELADWLRRGRYRTVLTPWRRDPHGDHRATTELLWAARALAGAPAPRVLEYPVWLGHQGDARDYPLTGEAQVYYRTCSRGVALRKRRALAAHRSQFGGVFDDPTGFTIPPALAAGVETPREYYFEASPPRRPGGGHDDDDA